MGLPILASPGGRLGGRGMHLPYGLCGEGFFVLAKQRNPEKPLAIKVDSCYNRLENKNAAAYECANTRKPAQVERAPTQRPLAAPHGTLYNSPAFLARGGFVVFVILSCVHKKHSCFLRRVGILYPAWRFCFSPVPAAFPRCPQH